MVTVGMGHTSRLGHLNQQSHANQLNIWLSPPLDMITAFFGHMKKTTAHKKGRIPKQAKQYNPTSFSYLKGLQDNVQRSTAGWAEYQHQYP